LPDERQTLKIIGLEGLSEKMEIMVFIILVGMFFLDHRLAKIRKIELELSKELQVQTRRLQEIANALQWMVDNWESKKAELQSPN
jgi:hypothetical protein